MIERKGKAEQIDVKRKRVLGRDQDCARAVRIGPLRCGPRFARGDDTEGGIASAKGDDEKVNDDVRPSKCLPLNAGRPRTALVGHR
jgi:hypothetical protein